MKKASSKRGFIVGFSALLGGASKLYNGPGKDLVSGYAWDVIVPIAISNMSLPGCSYVYSNKYLKAAFIFGIPSLAEFAQYLGLFPVAHLTQKIF